LFDGEAALNTGPQLLAATLNGAAAMTLVGVDGAKAGLLREQRPGLLSSAA